MTQTDLTRDDALADFEPRQITLDGILRSPRFALAYDWMARIQQPDGRWPAAAGGGRRNAVNGPITKREML